jgi:RHS repeat-associated protein
VTNALGHQSQQSWVLHSIQDNGTLYFYNGDVWQTTDPNGVTVSYSYDRLSRKTSEQTPTETRYFSYDDLNFLSTFMSDASGETRYAEDNVSGNTIYAEKSDPSGDPIGQTATYNNPWGQPYAVTTPSRWGASGASIGYTYDPLGRKTTKSVQGAGTTSMQYFGNTVTVISPENKQKKYTYNALGQVAQVNEQDSNGSLTLVTTYSYNTIGKLIQIVELGQSGQPNQTRTFTYDSLGRMTSETHPESGATTYTYDDNGNVHTKTDARSVVTSYTYDALNRVTIIGYSDATLWSYYYYDETGSSLISSITYGKGRRTSAWTRNSSGQIVADSVGYSWSYDSSGRVISQVAKIDNITYPVTYNFSSTGCGCTEKDLQSIIYPGNFQVNYTRDDNGRILSIKTPPGTYLKDKYVNGIDYGSQSGAISYITFGNSRRNSFGYDLIGRLQSLSVGSNPYPDAFYEFSYNSDSQISQIVENQSPSGGYPFTQTNDYDYDNLGHLASIQASKTDYVTYYYEMSSNFSYDRFGNMLSNQVVNPSSTETTTFNVNAANNRLISYWKGSTVTMSYDASGNVTARGSKNFVYDGANSLINAGNIPTIYRYDALGRRVKRSWNSGSKSVVSIWGALGELLEDYRSEPEAWGTKTTKTYYILAGSQTVARRIYTSTPDPYAPGYYYNTDSTEWLYRNHLSEVIAVDTDYGNASSVSSYPLQAFASGGNDQFQGHKDDPESGLHYNLARYYDPAISRWAAADSVTAPVYDPQSLNKYAYNRNDPINLVDPYGKQYAAGGESPSYCDIYGAVDPHC